MTWSIDGVPKWTLRQSDLGDAGGWQVLAADGKMVLFKVAVGGAFADAVAGAASRRLQTRRWEVGALPWRLTIWLVMPPESCRGCMCVQCVHVLGAVRVSSVIRQSY